MEESAMIDDYFDENFLCFRDYEKREPCTKEDENLRLIRHKESGFEYRPIETHPHYWLYEYASTPQEGNPEHGENIRLAWNRWASIANPIYVCTF
jgi:hypothetical protein